MDANGARFWQLTAADWHPTDDPDRVATRWGRVHLASQTVLPPLAEDDAAAAALRDRVPTATDALGAFTSVRPTGDQDALVVHMDGALDAHVFDFAGKIDGVCLDPQGFVTVAAGGSLHLRDSRTFGSAHEKWRTLEVPGFDAWRVSPCPDGGAWALDRAHRSLARWSGRVLRRAPDRDVAPGTFRPDPETPETVAVTVFPDGFEGDEPVAVAVSAEGRVAVLGWGADFARLHVFSAEGEPLRRLRLSGVRRPVGLSFVGPGRTALLAVTATGPAPDALVFPVDTTTDDLEVLPVGERYPLRRHDGGPLWVSWNGAPRYGTAAGARSLVPLSLPARPTRGGARARSPLDARRADTCWHRLYAEARIPRGCGIRLLLAATDSKTPPDAHDAWHPHDFGAVPRGEPGDRVRLADGNEVQVVAATATHAEVVSERGETRTVPREEIAHTFPAPRGTWVPARSELPNHLGTLGLDPSVDETGLFVVLVQRSRRQSTRLLGRYLHVRATLYGTGRLSPEIAAVRVYAPRFSYVREYLPELYHPDPQVDGSELRGAPAAPDFLERFTSLFEGVLTPLEDKVADAWQWTSPETAPAESLEWLAGWVGLTLDAGLSVAARRRMLAHAPTLARWRGTLRGLQLLLDIVTEGGVQRGDVIVIEEWRLRRTWATILGADLTDESDPLLLGLSVDTNSIVGDTLVLGDEHHREFLALYGPGVAGSADRAAVDAFFEASAFRVSVLVHEGLAPARKGVIDRALADGLPAHVVATVRRASRRFIVGVAALAGVDTRFGATPPPRAVQLGRSRVGEGDRVRRPAALHPDVEGEP